MQNQKNDDNQQPYPENQQAQNVQEQQNRQPQIKARLNNSLGDIPEFKLIGRGNGIDEEAFYIITHAAYEALNNREDPLSNGILKRIRKQIEGEWMIFACIQNLKGIDFAIDCKDNAFLCFTIKNFRFQICKFRD